MLHSLYLFILYTILFRSQVKNNFFYYFFIRIVLGLYEDYIEGKSKKRPYSIGVCV